MQSRRDVPYAGRRSERHLPAARRTRDEHIPSVRIANAPTAQEGRAIPKKDQELLDLKDPNQRGLIQSPARPNVIPLGSAQLYIDTDCKRAYYLTKFGDADDLLSENRRVSL